MGLRATFHTKPGTQGAIEAGNINLIVINKFIIYKDMRLYNDSKGIKIEEYLSAPSAILS